MRFLRGFLFSLIEKYSGTFAIVFSLVFFYAELRMQKALHGPDRLKDFSILRSEFVTHAHERNWCET
jgi:hypothetical protein